MTKRFSACMVILAVAALAASGAARPPADTAEPALRDDLSGYHRSVSTKSPLAQRYFDQGLTLFWGFNHAAAIASFQRAAELDPQCAMAQWGQAISLGPNINLPMYLDDEQARAAWDALQRARKLAKRAAPVERALIEALAVRYAYPAPADLSELNAAYAAAMRGVWRAYPNDPDVGALYADAMMNLRPWDLWKKNGEPQPGTPEIMATLETVLEMAPDHPGACHFYIHTCEASPFPQLALPAADRLRDRVPGAGHLVHMPSHIDIRLGRYAEVIEANQKAVAADNEWTASQGGIYAFYRAHNYHFLAYGAMFEGRRQLALEAARGVEEQIPLELVREMPDFLDAFLAVRYHVRVRFGQWEQMLSEPMPPQDMVATTAFWRYGRTVALASLGRVEEAGAELAELKRAHEAVPESRLLGNNTVRSVLEVGLPLAEGEFEYRRGNHERAFALLRQAVERDDALHYDEPWGWMMPARHALGALLLEQARLPEAEVVYREDLRRHPGNGWALNGLAEVLRLTGRPAEAQQVEALFAAAWERSDIKIAASCFCRTGQSASLGEVSRR